MVIFHGYVNVHRRVNHPSFCSGLSSAMVKSSSGPHFCWAFTCKKKIGAAPLHPYHNISQPSNECGGKIILRMENNPLKKAQRSTKLVMAYLGCHAIVLSCWLGNVGNITSYNITVKNEKQTHTHTYIYIYIHIKVSAL